MAIINTPIQQTADGKERIQLEINNGDLEALETIRKNWSFKDKESVLRFALAVLVQAENNTVYIDKGNDKKIALKPSDSLLEVKVIPQETVE